jgi:hypothetical protein
MNAFQKKIIGLLMNNAVQQSFITNFNGCISNRSLMYLSNELSFDMEPSVKGIGNYILINNIELVVDENGVVVFLSGLCPHTNWTKTNLMLPDCKKGVLKLEDELKSGFSYRLNDFDWPVYADDAKGWVCIGNPENLGQAIEFLPGCVAVIEYGNLVALWLKPKFLKPIKIG